MQFLVGIVRGQAMCQEASVKSALFLFPIISPAQTRANWKEPNSVVRAPLDDHTAQQLWEKPGKVTWRVASGVLPAMLCLRLSGLCLVVVQSQIARSGFLWGVPGRGRLSGRLTWEEQVGLISVSYTSSPDSSLNRRQCFLPVILMFAF